MKEIEVHKSEEDGPDAYLGEATLSEQDRPAFLLTQHAEVSRRLMEAILARPAGDTGEDVELWLSEMGGLRTVRSEIELEAARLRQKLLGGA